MRTFWAALTVAASLLVAGVAHGAPAPCAAVPALDDRCETWVAAYDHPGGHGTAGIDMAFASAASPDGRLVYVTGQSWDDDEDRYDFATVAYDAATGERRWLARYDGPGGRHDIPQAVALSRDGTRLYVTGAQNMNEIGEGAAIATVAYDAATGERLWAASYGAAPDGNAYGVAVSPDGEWVYVAGKSGSLYSDMDFATVAYDADTGAEAWSARYSSKTGAGDDAGISVVVAPDGRTVYTTGAAGTDWHTIAYAAGDREKDDIPPGTVLWEATEKGGYAYWIALAPDGSRLYVTGSDHTGRRGVLTPDWDYQAIAYRAADGERLWSSTYTGPTAGLDVPYANELSPDGASLYLTGSSTGLGSELNRDYATLAVDTATGAPRWVARYELPGALFEIAADVAVAPSGASVYVTGISAHASGRGDSTTIAYNAATGTQQWIARYNSLAWPQETDTGDNVAVSPTTGRVFVSGYSSYQRDPSDPLNQQPGTNSSDYFTLAYDP